MPAHAMVIDVPDGTAQCFRAQNRLHCRFFTLLLKSNPYSGVDIFAEQDIIIVTHGPPAQTGSEAQGS